MITATRPPDGLVGPTGEVRFGVYDQPCAKVDLFRTRLRTLGVPMPGLWSRFRLKEWQHYCLILPEAMVSFAIVDSKFLHTSWCHVVDRTSGAHFEHARQGPRLRARVARQLWNERTHLSARGYRIEVFNHLDHGEHRISIDIDADGTLPAVHLAMTCEHDLDAIQPLVVVLPVGPNRGMYSHKVALPLRGTLRVGDREHRVESEQGFAIVDVHKAHYPRRTWWNWATFAGRDAAGRLIAGNLTHNVNERDRELNENALWVDGALHHLGPARFEVDRERVLEPWRVRTDEAALVFTPEGERAQSIRLGLVVSEFHQPYGTFAGTVRLEGEEVEIDGLYGVCEDHTAVW